MTAKQSLDIASDHDVRMLVGHFYTRIREDAELGPIFNDVSTIDWVDHIPTMCEFWETVLFHRTGYKGDPASSHVQLDRLMFSSHGMGLRTKDFERWVAMFHETIDTLYSGPRAELAKRSASRMARQLMDEICRSRDLAEDSH